MPASYGQIGSFADDFENQAQPSNQSQLEQIISNQEAADVQ